MIDLVCRVEREEDKSFYAKMVLGEATVFAAGGTMEELWVELKSGMEVTFASPPLQEEDWLVARTRFLAAASVCRDLDAEN